MKHKILFISALIVSAFMACNPANRPEQPVVVAAPSDTIALRSQSGYYDHTSGSCINWFNVMQVAHATPTDSGFYMVRLDSALEATNYHLNMQLANVQHNNGRFDVLVNCKLDLAPVTDTTKDSAVLFIAQYNNGKELRFDTVKAHANDKNFTLHINNATSTFGYYIVLWNLYPMRNSTVTFRDIMIMKAK